jgi:hypothetical protein
MQRVVVLFIGPQRRYRDDAIVDLAHRTQVLTCHMSGSAAILAGLPARRRKYGLTMFRFSYTNSLGPTYSPAIFVPVLGLTSSNLSLAFWLKPGSIFGLFKLTRFISSSHLLAILFSLASLPPDAGSSQNCFATLLSLPKDFIVPVALNPVVTNRAHTGRLPLKKQRVSLPLRVRP